MTLTNRRQRAKDRQRIRRTDRQKGAKEITQRIPCEETNRQKDRQAGKGIGSKTENEREGERKMQSEETKEKGEKA